MLNRYSVKKIFVFVQTHGFSLLLLLLLFFFACVEYFSLNLFHPVIHGISGTYYGDDMQWQGFAWKKQIIDTEISHDTKDFQRTKTYFHNRFSVEWIGFIEITETGDYTFFTNSDDGSLLYIDGAKVVDNDGAHGLREAHGTIHLIKGLHKIRIRYFQIGGEAVLRVYWSKGQGPKIPLSSEVLFPLNTSSFRRYKADHIAMGIYLLLIAVCLSMYKFKEMAKKKGKSPNSILIWVLGLAIGIYVYGFPLTSATELLYHALARYDKHIDYSAQELREVCQRYSPGEVSFRVDGNLTSLNNRSTKIYQLAKLPSLYHGEMMQQLYSMPCMMTWGYKVFSYYPTYFPAYTPYLWLIDQYGISDIYPSLLLLLGSYVGLCCLFFITKKLSGSNLLGLFSLFCPYFYSKIASIPVNLDIFNVFVTIYLGQVLASSSFLSSGVFRCSCRWARIIKELIVLALFSVHFLTYLFAWPITFRYVPLLLIVTLLAGGGLCRHKTIVFRAVFAGLLLVLFHVPYQHYTATLLSPISKVNHAVSGAWGPFWIVTGLYEQPTYLGMPLGENVYYMVSNFDPLLGKSHKNPAFAPVTVFNQMFRPWGLRLWKEQLFHRPLEYLTVLWTRFLLQIEFHDTYRNVDNHQVAKFSPEYLENLIFITGISLICWNIGVLLFFRFDAWPILLSPIVSVLWMIFGGQCLTSIYHVHRYHFVEGLFILACLLPGFLGWGIISTKITISRMHGYLSTKSFSFNKKLIILFVIAGGALVVTTPYFIREYREAKLAFQAWRLLFLGKPFDEIQKILDLIIKMDRRIPGAAEMYAAWITDAYWGWCTFNKAGCAFRPEYSADENKAGRELFLSYYRETITLGRSNPYYSSYAKLVGLEDWEEIFKAALQNHPDSPYATYMAYQLVTEGRIPITEKEYYTKMFDDLYAELLRDTKKFRVGLQRYPQVLQSKKAEISQEEEGLAVKLRSGGEIVVQGSPTYHDPETKVILFVKVLRGKAIARVVGENNHSEEICEAIQLEEDNEISYRIFQCGTENRLKTMNIQIQASTEECEVLVRDKIPVFENPRFYSPGMLKIINKT